MSTLLVLLLSLSPQSADFPDLEHLDPAVREIEIQKLGKKKATVAIQPLIARLELDDSSVVRESAQRALEVITGRTDLKNVDAWKAWWNAEGRSLYSTASRPPDSVMRDLQAQVLETELRFQATKKEVRAIAIIGLVALLLFVLMMLFFVGHVSSKIKGWRDLVGRAEIYIKHSQELTQRTDQIAAELDAKKTELAAAMETLRKEQEDEISRRGDEAGTALEHRLRMELQTLRQKAERELDQTVTDLKTQLETTARRAAAEVRDRLAK